MHFFQPPEVLLIYLHNIYITIIIICIIIIIYVIY